MHYSVLHFSALTGNLGLRASVLVRCDAIIIPRVCLLLLIKGGEKSVSWCYLVKSLRRKALHLRHLLSPGQAGSCLEVWWGGEGWAGQGAAKMLSFCAAPQCMWTGSQTWPSSGSCTNMPDGRSGWIIVRRANVEDETADQVNKRYRLCVKHVETWMICTTSL